MRIFFIVFLISFKFSIAQPVSEVLDTSNTSIALSLSAERNDFYTTFTYLRSIESFSVNPSLGFGLVHSVFQANPFVRAGIDIYYNPVDKTILNCQKVLFGVGLGYYFSFYNRPTFTNNHELCAGYLFRFGKRLKFIQKTFIGILKESFMGNNERVHLVYPNFHLSMGLSYDL